MGSRIIGANFLDLFAGSGAFSFEAVSRGAAEATAIDSSKKNVDAIERLAKEWRVSVKALLADVLSTTHQALSTIVYADPPYDFARYDDLLAVIGRLSLSPDALVAIEHRRKTDLASETKQLRFVRRAEYGEVWISMYAAIDGLRGE